MATVRSKNRSYLKDFLNWTEKQKWLTPKTPDNKKEIYRFSGEKHERIQRKRLTNRKGQFKRYALSFDVSDYLREGNQEQEEFIKSQLERISTELQDFGAYMRKRGYREISINTRFKMANRLLGWLHYIKGVPLEELSLSSLIPVVRLKYSLSEFPNYHDYIYTKGLAQEEAKKATESIVKKLEEYWEWLEQAHNKPSPSSKAIYSESTMAIACFLYRNETDEEYANQYEDIPVVRRLRIYTNKLEIQRRNSPPAVPFHKKAVSWETVLMVLEKLRYEANMTYSDSLVNGEHKKKKRPIKAIANSMMRFLLLAMFVIVPPDRQRTFRELQLGETLKHGTFKGGMFIPRKKMLNPDEAKFYIHLLPEQYKTGDSYGEWVGELPNTKFTDKSTFYQYLERWLYSGYQENGEVKGLREALKPENHNYVFFGKYTKEPLSIEALTAKIKNVFERHTGVPVPPHTLRTIFRSYIKEKGASPQELESVAFWMKHSLRTADNTYTFLECSTKLRTGAALADRINSEILKDMTNYLP